MQRDRRFVLPSVLLLAVTAGLMLVTACAEDHSQFLDPAGNDPAATGLTPPVPHGVVAQVGDLRVILTWVVDSPAGVSGYRVFRRAGDDPERVLASSVSETTYTDATVTNGTAYTYRVAAILDNGLVGDRSANVTVTPGPFTALVNDGDTFTNSRNVTVSVTAPAGTTALRIGETPDLSSVAWRGFSAFTSFELGAAEGTHTVYVQFRDGNGNPTSIMQDDIVLDTLAEISAVTHDGAATPIPPGTVIHFDLDAGEINGRATIDIGSARTGIVLLDDGAHGDGAASDGEYGVDFQTPVDLEVADAAVIGRFRDAAGNVADARTASGTLTLNAPPTAVTLEPPFNVQETSLSLRWSRSLDADFGSYLVFRSKTGNVLNDPDREIVQEVSNPSATTLTDGGLTEGTTYFYLVQSVDDLGATATSNTVSATTGDTPPDAVDLNDPVSVGATQVALSWSRSPSDDFAAYILYRSEQAGVDDTDTEIVRQTNRDVVSALDAGLTENTLYYYRLYVEDAGGLRTPGAPLAVRTSNVAPAAVSLDTVTPISSTAIQLGWSMSDAHDFESYVIRRDENALVDEASTLVRTVTNRASTSLVDTGLTENTRYYYRVFVTDTGDSTSASAVVSGTTNNVAPPPVTLTEAGHTSLSVSLTWTVSTAHDFARYRIMLAPESTPGVFSEVGSLTDAQQVAFTDFFPEVSSPTVFFYKVVTEDTAAGATDSNVVAVTVTP